MVQGVNFGHACGAYELTLAGDGTEVLAALAISPSRS
jgi:hypothetical protein